jgi:plastocyanin
MLSMMRSVWLMTVALAGTLFAAGCGGGYKSPAAPSSSSGTSTATITLSGRAASPNAVTIARGDKVTFVNNDTVAHTVASDPHPVHTDCPALNVGTLAPGQQRDSGTLTVARTCGFHDHDDPDNVALHGTITIQ